MSSKNAASDLYCSIKRRLLRYELLESRFLLAADSSGLADLTVLTDKAIFDNPQPSAPLTWFESFQTVDRVPLGMLTRIDDSLPDGVAGPLRTSVGEWIVQLTDSASKSITHLSQANGLLTTANCNFTIISGLGAQGLLLVRGQGATKQDIELSLSENENVKSFSLNQLVQGQATIPNDPEFVAGLMPGMERIDAKNAWDVSRGSSSTVVGVVDTGIDPTHPDLYLNIWLNQGELPPKYLDDVGPRLVDIDGDGLITFYDLNNATRTLATPFSLTVGGFATGPNASFVVDKNSNGRIDAIDLLQDANWADGRDTDNNGFFDDFFGVNFRSGAADPFASNNPSDELGHGTHVAGTIGAIGGNGTGVVGVNWQTSLMSLRILDNNNQGDSGAAIRAVNYAREMREQYRVDTAGRVTQGANVRVLNNSWGQPGGYEVSLEAAIRDSSDAGILFVAAAGNGNFLGQGVDNDRTPFYPASYDVLGVIAVAASASDSTDRPASFSNFGAKSVDLVAPGVGIRSTLPGGGYGSANGTSMATPHVAGTAALIWSTFPEATVDEVQKAILSTVDPITNGSSIVSTGGRLSASKAINADVFAPSARLVAKQDITVAGGTITEFTVEYSHRSGINTTSIGNDDLIITRQWGPADQLVAIVKPNSLTTTAKTATVVYIVTAPGGIWDALDFGDYLISTVAGKVTSLVGNKTTEARDIGFFNVRINASSVLYVNTFADSLEPGTLRSQIIAANAASPAPRTIILEAGKYTIDVPAVVDPTSKFGTSLNTLGINNPGGWSNATTGDFDIQGNIAIIGDINDETIIDAQGKDRAFKVDASSTLTLSRLTVQGGVSPAKQGGGGILSIGNLNLDQAILKKNTALGFNAANPIFGGAIASWSGNTSINESWITENQSDFGGAFYYGGTATATVQRSTMNNNKGGAIYSSSLGNGTVENSTLSANSGGYGAIANGFQNGFLEANGTSNSPMLSGDGRYVMFGSNASNLVPGDTNGIYDIFMYDRVTKVFERVNVSDTGVQSNNNSRFPSLSDNGRYVTFTSSANNLVAGDTNGSEDVFVYDRTTKLIERVSVNDAGVEGNSGSLISTLSADGRYVTFRSNASNLVSGDSNSRDDIFVFDRTTKQIERVSVTDAGVQGNNTSDFPSISANGRYVSFASNANNLVSGDTNARADIFVYDRTAKKIERVNISDAGLQGNNDTYEYSSLSSDGRYVTFSSNASNLVPGDTNGVLDIFVYDRTTKLIERVSVSAAGVQGNGNSGYSLLSGDGRYVTIFSDASNLVPGDTNGRNDRFVYDRTTKLIELISTIDAAAQGNGNSGIIGFCCNSAAGNLIAGSYGRGDVIVYDLTTKRLDAITYLPTKSVIDVLHTTIASTPVSNVNAAVYGDLKINNSLLVGNQGVQDVYTRLGVTVSNNNIFSSTPQSDLVSSLQRSGTRPPVHNLRAGNPAINAATSASAGTQDQLGQMRVIPDIGAVEAVFANVSGKVYVDQNRNGQLDAVESGVPGVAVTLNGPAAAVLTSQQDDPQTSSVNEDGFLLASFLTAGNYQFSPQPVTGFSSFKSPLEIIRSASLQANNGSDFASFSAEGRYVTFNSGSTNLVSGDTNAAGDVFVYDRTTKVFERVSLSDAGVQGNGSSSAPSISADGRFVSFLSDASNLVAGDTNAAADVFVYDRTTKLIERVSVSNAGVQGNAPSASNSFIRGAAPLSADGRYVTYHSFASNLISGDSNNSQDIFVYDRSTKLIERVSVSDAGVQGNGTSATPSLSADGRYVTFTSTASNLIAGDTNSGDDIFVYDRTTKVIERVSVTDAGLQVISSSSFPWLSANGRYVAFLSIGVFVPGDTNGTNDIFVYDRTTKKIERVSVNDAGVEGNGSSTFPSLSGDGRFVAFRSSATNLGLGDTNVVDDIFVYDRTTKRISRVNVSDAGVQGDAFSLNTSLSGDGRYVSFSTASSTLVSGDTNNFLDAFIALNPLAPPGLTLNLQAGQVYTDLNFGLVPYPGTISGRVFEDSVSNGVFDTGEPVIENAAVFLDLNSNGILDAGERSVNTASDGTYQFLKTDSYRLYSIVVQVPIGYEQFSPGKSQNFAWNIFLPVGGTVPERDFAIRRVQSTGQSSASAVSGRLFDDRDGDKIFSAGDIPIVNREVYLDATNFGIRDTNEPRVLTDASGLYSIDGLSSRTVAVTTTLDESLIHLSPLGSDFKLQKFPLFSSLRPFGNPQAIASGDFNQDGFLDVAVALGEGNKLSLRLNNGQGGFLANEIDIDLGINGSGPTSIVVGQFDSDSKLDVAVTAHFSSKVVVLLNFNPTTKSFASLSYVDVGLLPLDIVAGQFGGDSKLDLVVVNKGASTSVPTVASTVQVLTNNGSGIFTAGPPIPSGGKDSVSLVAGNFTGDTSLDVAVVHASPATTNTPFGGVTLLRGNGTGGLVLQPSYVQVGALPIDSAIADFNADGRTDLAVANFSSNSISILLSQADGTLRNQTSILGTASGAFDIAVGDMDNDGDIDVIASNLNDRNISIFRNIGVDSTTGEVRFEPLENIGLGQFELAQRMPLIVGNFDNDSSGPRSTGTLDIVAIPQQTNTLNVLKNKLVNGTHRVALTGVNRVASLDFIISSAILSPKFNAIVDPAPIVEDANEQSVAITGIALGRTGGPALRITANSGNSTIIPDPFIDYVAGATTGSLRFTPVKDASGQVAITVTARDAGADKQLDTSDDAVLSRVFTVTIKPVNDAPTFDFPSSRVLNAPEDSGERIFNGFISNITPGGGTFESGQTLSAFLVVADNLALFMAQPIIDASGTLRFTPAANAVGTATVTVTLTDNGDTDFGGTNRKIDQFVLTINPVNDAPSISIGGKQTVLVGAAAQSVSNFATGFAPGGGTDENAQGIAGFVISVDKPDLFSVLPTIDSEGTLRYFPSSTRTGMTKVSVQVRDNGGSNNGGVDLSILKSFDIEVAPLPDTVEPKPAISSTTPAITNASPVDFSVDFGEAITGFVLSDLVLTNATATNLVDLGAGKFSLSLTPIADGALIASIPAAAAKDLANNNSLASTTFSRTVDRTAPVANITTSEPNPANRLSFPIAFNFDEAVLGFDLSDLVLGNCTVSGLTETVPGKYSATLTTTTDGVVFVGFSAGVAHDAAGNGNTAPSPLLIAVNAGSSTYKPLLSTTESSPTPNRNFIATIDFGRVVTGFDAPDLELTNATTTLTELGSGRYRLNLSAISEGSVTVRLLADRVRDSSNRTNDASDLLTIRFVDTSNSDFGDAPSAAQSGFASSYPTLLVDNGAFHSRSDLTLGAGFDVETNGQPNATATGDDLSNFDDEDGILFPITNAISPSGNTTSSFIAIASGVGFLDAWIDFNRDGDWSDLGEQIATQVAVVKGRNNLAFTISASASAGATFGRFRLSSVGGLPPTGPAADGEVEDQQIVFVRGVSQDLRLSAVELGSHEISVVSNTLVVSVSGKAIWSSPISSVNKFTAVDSTLQTLYEVANPAANLLGTIRFLAIDEPVELRVSSSNLVLTGLVSDKLFGVQKIDLTQLGANTLTFAKNDIQGINLQKKLRIVMERMDTLVTTSDWILQTGRLENNTWVQPYRNGDATIEIVSDTAWQNKVLTLDVDGDRSISPLDVLLLINAINSNAFSGGTLPQRGSIAQTAFLDPDGDNSLSPLDVLTVINRINRGEGEGEGNGEIKAFFAAKRIDELMVGNIDELLSDRDFLNGEYASNGRRRSKRG